MSEQTSQEPTMEEILASIRRIISEDDAPPAAEAGAAPAAAAEPAAAEVEPEPEPVAEAAPEPAPAPAPPPPVEPEPIQPSAVAEAADDDALELTDKVETHGDIDVYTPSAAAPAVAVEPVRAPAPSVEGLVSDRAASVAATAFGQLSAAIAMPREGRTLEDVVRELLRPLLHQWLDDNLPAIVQAAVEAEVERIARGRVR